MAKTIDEIILVLEVIIILVLAPFIWIGGWIESKCRAIKTSKT